MIRKRIAVVLEEAVERCKEKGLFPRDVDIRAGIEIPREEGHGDYSTTAAFSLAKPLRRSPAQIAAILIEQMDYGETCSKVEIAGNGFINFFVKDEVFRSALREIKDGDIDAFIPDTGKGAPVLLEFVSANPTGPLHIGHGRGAAVGDVLANMLKKAGYMVTKEYYVNDAGRQIGTLGRSVYLRWKELQGETVEYLGDLYQGDYVREIAAGLIKDGISIPEDENRAIPFLARFAAEIVMTGIQGDLEGFRVHFDNYYRETSLYERGLVEDTIRLLKEKGCLFEEEGALWFKSSLLGDEKDRVIVKSDGEKTYLASDIAYHRDKFDRGFEILIDIWGSDHHGYIARLKASAEALGRNRDAIRVMLIQFVTLLKDGKPVGMSTRSGQFTTLREVTDEVGADAARFFFLMRKSDAHLEFDLDLAKKTSNENPVYYVQYANARIESIFRLAKEDGIDLATLCEADIDLLVLREETELIKEILNYYNVVDTSVRTLEPHRITFYLIGLVGKFHSYYNKVRILKNETDLTRARLVLLKKLQEVIVSGLGILGVSAPERM
jgi:arginyl-tRNA synthetase